MYTSEIPLPRIMVTPEILSVFQAYIDTAQEEISGLGEVAVEHGDFFITRLHLFTQKVTVASTDLDQDALFDFLEEAVVNGFDLSKIKLWWHSHANSQVFWSPRDESTIARLSNSGWMLSIVGNKYKEHLARLDIYKPVHVRLDLAMHVIPPALPPDQQRVIEQEIARKVTSVSPSKKLLKEKGIKILSGRRGK
jgi:hypothetical protein